MSLFHPICHLYFKHEEKSSFGDRRVKTALPDWYFVLGEVCVLISGSDPDQDGIYRRRRRKSLVLLGTAGHQLPNG